MGKLSDVRLRSSKFIYICFVFSHFFLYLFDVKQRLKTPSAHDTRDSVISPSLYIVASIHDNVNPQPL